MSLPIVKPTGGRSATGSPDAAGRPTTGRRPPYPDRVTADLTLADVLRRVTADPGRPRLTWYGAGGERIELSGAVLANWVAKTTNLLVEEFDAGPGTRVVLDLPRTGAPSSGRSRPGAAAPRSWSTTALRHAGTAGATEADVVVTDRPAEHRGRPGRRASSPSRLPALARRVRRRPARAARGRRRRGDDLRGRRSAGCRDARAGRSRRSTGPPGPARSPSRTPSSAAWVTGGPAAAGGRACSSSPRTTAGRASSRCCARVLAALAADGSVVVLAPAVVAELATDPDRRERLAAGERVTAG